MGVLFPMHNNRLQHHMDNRGSNSPTACQLWALHIIEFYSKVYCNVIFVGTETMLHVIFVGTETMLHVIFVGTETMLHVIFVGTETMRQLHLGTRG